MIVLGVDAHKRSHTVVAVDEVGRDEWPGAIVDEDVLAVAEGVESDGDGVASAGAAEDDVGLGREAFGDGGDGDLVGGRNDDGHRVDAGVDGEDGNRAGDDGAPAKGCQELVDTAHALAGAGGDDDGAGGHGDKGQGSRVKGQGLR